MRQEGGVEVMQEGGVEVRQEIHLQFRNCIAVKHSVLRPWSVISYSASWQETYTEN